MILLAVGLLWLVVGFVAVFQPEGIFEAETKTAKAKDQLAGLRFSVGKGVSFFGMVFPKCPLT